MTNSNYFFNDLLGRRYGAVVFADTETTGLDPMTGQVIELAGIRVELNDLGIPAITDECDVLIKLNDGQVLTDKISELTHITNEMLDREGISEAEATARFRKLTTRHTKGGKRILFIAYNAQFDLQFICEMLKRNGYNTDKCGIPDCLDALTVFKDRHAYPHKLANAIEAYGLQNVVENSHRAIGDVKALYEVTKAMCAERDDLVWYINLFGYNPRYGAPEMKFETIMYAPQPFNYGMTDPDRTLPATVGRHVWAS